MLLQKPRSTLCHQSAAAGWPGNALDTITPPGVPSFHPCLLKNIYISITVLLAGLTAALHRSREEHHTRMGRSSKASLQTSFFSSPSCRRHRRFSDRVCGSPAVRAPQIHSFADNSVGVILRDLQKIRARGLLRVCYLGCFGSNTDFKIPVLILCLYRKQGIWSNLYKHR